MFYRVRTSLTERPGALALLATRCGEAGLNILGLQIFPEIERVTDELVVSTPQDWRPDDLVDLVAAAGGTAVAVMRCTEAALADQPTRYVHAARTLSDRPSAFLDVVAQLFDAEPDRPGVDGPEQDLMELTVRDVTVQVRRAAPFTATERARAMALAELVSEILTRRHGPVAGDPASAGEEPAYEVGEARVAALVAGHEIGRAAWRPSADDRLAASLSLSVDPAWRRLGVGSRLLQEAVRAALEDGTQELVIDAAADDEAVLPLVMSVGLRGRIRVSAETLTVRIPIRQLLTAERRLPGP